MEIIVQIVGLFGLLLLFSLCYFSYFFWLSLFVAWTLSECEMVAGDHHCLQFLFASAKIVVKESIEEKETKFLFWDLWKVKLQWELHEKS